MLLVCENNCEGLQRSHSNRCYFLLLWTHYHHTFCYSIEPVVFEITEAGGATVPRYTTVVRLVFARDMTGMCAMSVEVISNDSSDALSSGHSTTGSSSHFLLTVFNINVLQTFVKPILLSPRGNPLLWKAGKILSLNIFSPFGGNLLVDILRAHVYNSVIFSFFFPSAAPWSVIMSTLNTTALEWPCGMEVVL